jgi:asparagine synthase (glutamine-hydrolysing)
MCGIAGIYDPHHSLGLSGDLIRRMTGVVRHRGPDEDGFYEDGSVALGMRRLSIIDLATGKQPVVNEDGTVHAVYNGEIYNFQELRSWLEGRGHTFRTRTDSEVIVHAYEEDGADCVKRFRGMFAFALWDTRARMLLIGRDRLGIKPLHYLAQGGALVFGSELKSVLCHPKVAREIDLEALDYFFTYRYIPDPLTIFRGIRKLPAGHVLTARDGKVEERAYWDVPEPDEEAARDPRLAEHLLARIDEAVRVRLVSDVPLGAFLSGGIDSSTVVSAMAKEMKEPVKTFSIGFEEEGFDEVGYARITSRKYGTDHHERVVGAADFRTLEEIVGFFDEPFGDISSVPTLLLSKLAREHVTVALSGDGGDELFAGYERYRVDRAFARLDRLPLALRREVFGTLARLWPAGFRGRELLARLGRDRIDRYLASGASLHASRRAALYSPALLAERGADLPRDRFLAHWDGRRGDPVDRLLYLDIKTYLVGDILTKVDRMSMATSLEVRVPLLDHPLVEFAMRIPARLKLVRGQGKAIFREAVAGRVPREVMERPKHGFNVPVLGWVCGALAGYTDDVLLDPRAASRPYFNREWVTTLLRDPRLRREHAYLVWLLLLFELWHRRYLDAPEVSRGGEAIA